MNMYIDEKKLPNECYQYTVHLFGFRRELSSIKADAFGSGFIFSYGSNSYLVTTAHLIWKGDMEDTSALEKDLLIKIDTNISKDDKVGIIDLPLPHNFIYFTTLDENSESIIFDRYDLTISVLKKDLPISFFSMELKDFNPSVHGIKRITEKMIDNFDNHSTYSLSGTVNNRYNKKGELERDSVLITGLKLDKRLVDGTIRLYNSDFNTRGWNFKGLSGAPIFNNSGKACGMLMSVSKDTNYFTAIPIHQIIERIFSI